MHVNSVVYACVTASAIHHPLASPTRQFSMPSYSLPKWARVKPANEPRKRKSARM